MEFQTKIVEGKKNRKAWLARAGAVLLIGAVFLSLADGYERYALWALGVAAVLLVGGAILAKGDLADIEVSAKDLVVSSREIRIGEVVYPLEGITAIDFMVEGYDGMQGIHFSRPSEGVLNGMGNYLDFSSQGEKVHCYFYLAGPEAVQQLGLLFREFYEKRIVFVERNMGSRTFLFQAVTEGELEDLKLQNGY